MKVWIKRAGCNCWIERRDKDKHYEEVKGFCHCPEQPCCQIIEVNTLSQLFSDYDGFTIRPKSEVCRLYDGLADKEVEDMIVGVLQTEIDC